MILKMTVEPQPELRVACAFVYAFEMFLVDPSPRVNRL